jgi:hypothetical protein
VKVKWYLLFISLFGIFGYLRERFFEHMNFILASVYRGIDEYAIGHITPPTVMKPFLNWSYPTLYYSKYPFTILWVALFWVLGFFTLKKLAEVKKLTGFLNKAYLIMISAAFISMAIGYLINDTLKNDEYTFSRWLLGITQSPLICLILLASEKLYLKSSSHDK